MNRLLLGLSLVGTLTLAPLSLARAEDQPKVEKQDDGKHHQILKGAVTGAIVGHYAGHHAVKGAIAGATAGAIKRHYDKKAAKKKAAEATKTENGASSAH